MSSTCICYSTLDENVWNLFFCVFIFSPLFLVMPTYMCHTIRWPAAHGSLLDKSSRCIREDCYVRNWARSGRDGEAQVAVAVPAQELFGPSHRR
jgi:hypothetical protein